VHCKVGHLTVATRRDTAISPGCDAGDGAWREQPRALLGVPRGSTHRNRTASASPYSIGEVVSGATATGAHIPASLDFDAAFG